MDDGGDVPGESDDSREQVIAACEDSGNGIRLTWSDGYESWYHYIWLRDCCHCPDCGDCYSSKRYLVPGDLDLNIRPASISISAGRGFEVTWAPDGHQSCYDPAWLRRNSYDAESRRARRHKPKLWDSRISSGPPSVDYNRAAQDDSTRLELCRNLRDWGFVVVTGGLAERGGVAKVANLIGDLGRERLRQDFRSFTVQ